MNNLPPVDQENLKSIAVYPVTMPSVKTTRARPMRRALRNRRVRSVQVSCMSPGRIYWMPKRRSGRPTGRSQLRPKVPKGPNSFRRPSYCRAALVSRWLITEQDMLSTGTWAVVTWSRDQRAKQTILSNTSLIKTSHDWWSFPTRGQLSHWCQQVAPLSQVQLGHKDTSTASLCATVD